MTGKTHFVMNAMTLAAIGDTYALATAEASPTWLQTAAQETSSFMLDSGGVPFGLFVPSCLLLYLLGSLLPDVDHPYSMIGKVIHIPVGHRTWLHAAYVPVLLFVGGIWFRPLAWLGLGYFFHLFWDSFSRSGTDWFYPHKGKHRLKLYYTNKGSEYVFATIVCFLIAVYTAIVVHGRLDAAGFLSPSLD